MEKPNRHKPKGANLLANITKSSKAFYEKIPDERNIDICCNCTEPTCRGYCDKISKQKGIKDGKKEIKKLRQMAVNCVWN